LHDVGIDLEIRTFEFATFYADVVHGAFQIYTLRWVVGSNQDPEIFEYILDSKSFAPRRANRSYYSNPQVDTWIEQARQELDQNKRKEIYAKIQEAAFRDLPSLNLWSLDNVIVHTKRVENVHAEPAGNYDFLRVAKIAQ
jgi:peptide/nickel transport system substrate-binding protein